MQQRISRYRFGVVLATRGIEGASRREPADRSAVFDGPVLDESVEFAIDALTSEIDEDA